MRNRKSLVIAASAMMLVSSVLGATAIRAPGAGALDAPPMLPDAVEPDGAHALLVPEPVLTGGTGETLVLVVAAQLPAADAPARLAEVNAGFGELQGFALDSAEHYEPVAHYLREGPDWLEVPCEDALGCPDATTTVKELQPVALRWTPLDTTASALVAGHTLVLTGFRTKRGAEEFLELARAAGLQGLTVLQARKLGGGDIGLGQEPHPDGSGPLLGPLPDQESFQR